MKAALYVAAAVLVAALVAWGLWSFDPFGRRKHAETKAVTATQQAAVATKTIEVLDRVVRSEIVIRNQAQGAVENVQAAVGSETPLPPAVAASVRDGVERLRNPAGAGDDHPSSQPADALR